MPNGRTPRDHRAQVAGWILFVVCALFFVAAGWRDRDPLVTVGGVLFLLGCFFFLIPLLRSRPR
jgi:hypothetical protein